MCLGEGGAGLTCGEWLTSSTFPSLAHVFEKVSLSGAFAGFLAALAPMAFLVEGEGQSRHGRADLSDHSSPPRGLLSHTHLLFTSHSLLPRWGLRTALAEWLLPGACLSGLEGAEARGNRGKKVRAQGALAEGHFMPELWQI